MRLNEKRVEVPILVLLEELRWQKTIIGSLDSLIPKITYGPDREHLWEIREDLLGIFARDLNLKKGVSPHLLVRGPK